MIALPSWWSEPVEAEPSWISLAGEPAPSSSFSPVRPSYDFGTAWIEQMRRATVIADEVGGRPEGGWTAEHLEGVVIFLAPAIPGLRYRFGGITASHPAPRPFWYTRPGRKRAGRPKKDGWALLEAVESLKWDPGRKIKSDAEALLVLRRTSPELTLTNVITPIAASDSTLLNRVAAARRLTKQYQAEATAAEGHFSGQFVWSVLNPGRRHSLVTWALAYWLLDWSHRPFEDFLLTLK